jgi:autophagy-related protein 11
LLPSTVLSAFSDATSLYMNSWIAGVSEGNTDDQDVDTNEDDIGGDEIAGTSKLEVENAWLKSELASAVAMLCNLDPDYEIEGAGDSQDPQNGTELDSVGRAQLAAQKTAEALQMKDEHAKHLVEMLAMRQVYICAFSFSRMVVGQWC